MLPAPWRMPAYLFANAMFMLAVSLGIAMHAQGEPRIAFLAAMFALCSLPLALMQRINDRYVMLAILLALLFTFYALADLAAVLDGSAPARGQGIVSEAEAVILAGVAALIVGYVTAVRFTRDRSARTPPPDWTPMAVVLIGLVLWGSGTAAVYYWQIHVVVRRSVEINNDLGNWATLGIMFGRMIQPLGIMILAYAMARYRRAPIAALVIGIVCLQIGIGFLADSKETAMRAGLIVIIVLLLVRGRVPKVWLGAAALFVVFAFPVFQAYRAQVSGTRGYTNAEAAANFGKVLDIAIASTDKVKRGFGGKQFRAQSFVERTSLKSSVEIVVARAGKDVRFQNGDTLLPMVTAFIPRVFWPDKPDVATGQVFNREFRISDYRDVYISPSHLGELYWNFGWAGALLGMFAIGALLGHINARCDLSQHASVTRLLMVAVTVYSLCVRFEGSIAVEYTVWMRSIAAVALLHWVFARRAAGTTGAETLSGIRTVDYLTRRASEREPVIGGGAAQTP